MLDGVRAAVNTVTFATPWLGGGIALLVATTPLRRAPWWAQAVSGAITGGAVAAGWEYTVNSSDRPELKWEIIGGSAAIGAGAGVVGPILIPTSSMLVPPAAI